MRPKLTGQISNDLNNEVVETKAAQVELYKAAEFRYTTGTLFALWQESDEGRFTKKDRNWWKGGEMRWKASDSGTGDRRVATEIEARSRFAEAKAEDLGQLSVVLDTALAENKGLSSELEKISRDLVSTWH